MVLEEFALNLVIELLGGAIQAGVSYAAVPYFTRRKIERRVEDATAEVVESMLPFLSQERIPEDRQRRLIQTCVEELRPLAERPEMLFQGSLNGQKIFENLYRDRDLPQTVVEDGLRDVYALLFPRIATLLCKIPAAVKDWENEAWVESYRRLDEITSELRALFIKIDSLTAQTSKEADEILLTVRRTISQKIGLEMELTGLRADQPVAAKFDDLFVHPIVKRIVSSKATGDRSEILLVTKDQSYGEFIRANMSVIIVAPPGAGKSTWAKWLQRETLVVRQGGIAVRVELRRLVGESLPTLNELIREASGKHLAEELTPELLSRWLKSNQVVFILDGFDEIRVHDRDSVQQWIIELKGAARSCPFVLTSRPLTTDHLESFGNGWLRWTIEPFNQGRIVDYIQRWHKHMPLLLEGAREINASDLAEDWISDPTIEPLTGNPLLLSTLLMVHHLDGRLPSGRAQLYRRYVDGMLGVWDDRRKVEAASIQFTLEQKRQILRGLALRMFLQEHDQLDEPVTIGIVEQLLQELSVTAPPEAVLALLRERTGLLVGPGIYSFVHKSVAEYLVAEAIVQGDQRDARGDRIDRFNLFEHRNDDRWNTVMFLWAGLAPVTDVEAFIDECEEGAHTRLAYGLLLDQYDRITKTKRRELLVALLSKTYETDGDFGGNWVSSQPASDQAGLVALAFVIRGLSPDVDIEQLIYRAYEDGTLKWSDADGYHGLFRDILWTRVVTEPKSLDEWANALSSKWPDITNSARTHWLLWVIERTLLSYLFGESIVDIMGIAKQLNNLDLNAPRVELLAFISSFITAEEPTSVYGKRSRVIPERINELLAVLVTLDFTLLDQRWLIHTRSWTIGWFDHDGAIDLVSLCIDKLTECSQHGFADKELASKAIRYLEEVLTLRGNIHGGRALT